ncbi:MAG: F0F1 ATP synthase subunit alpha [Desulfobacterales bacterium C00003060]|nr:MAG: F0F1 ATP synthase subunit alpha [Desulfobacterales bacterium S3730MH5]OEU80653.1 MAG: F0F1 ATP synthase subunit alpha [Desulfobacterales bacterium C00003060]
MEQNTVLRSFLDDTFTAFDRVLEGHRAELKGWEVGTTKYVGQGIARLEGLPRVKSEELVRFPGDVLGMVFNMDPSEVGVILLDESPMLKAGTEVRRTGRVLDVPVGDELIGRVVDAMGRPLDILGPVRTSERRPVEREAPEIMDRAPVTVPLLTGLKVVDALIPIGRGQRELILGDRQTGKTAIALDTMINQKDKEVLCVYCAIGQRSSSVAKLIDDLRRHDALANCIIVVAEGESPPGLQFVAPYAATTMAEYFMEQGRDVLIVYDDLTRHAQAYREISLLLRRPPGREAFPGDIFYIHSRLLERATHLREELGGGSLSAMPIVETEAQNISAYIPTNIVSITDGQIYLTPNLFQKGVLPAVDVGKSVSRVGGKTQLAAYRTVAGNLRLSYSQFEELETFSRFGTRLDEETRKTLDHGRRVREILKQPQYQPMSVPEQIAVLLAVTEGIFDQFPPDRIAGAEQVICKAVTEGLPDLCIRIQSGDKFRQEDINVLINTARKAIEKENAE